MDRNGNVIIVWSRFAGSNFRIEARTLSAAGRLSPIQIVMDAQETAGPPQLAVHENGSVAVVWNRFLNDHQRIQLRTRSAAGIWRPIQTLSAAGQSGDS